jgi:phosphomethylpyrimidine synthase
MTLIEKARKGLVTPEMKQAAAAEGIAPALVRDEIAAGRTVIALNSRRKVKIRPLAVGKYFSVKVNANIGTSRDQEDLGVELAKLDAALEAGTDAVMDLSTGGDLDAMRAEVIARSPVAVGTVPLYQSAKFAMSRGKSFLDVTAAEMFKLIERQLSQGVDFITVHCGVTRQSREALQKDARIMGVVSRGGALTLEWMKHNSKENPLYENYDELLALAHEYDATLSLGDGFRPGSVLDATDRGQVAELVILGELAGRALEAGVQAIIEGPGHVPLNQVEANIMLQKRLCNDAPFYVLGPLVTDIAAGYDHITSAIGGAIAAAAGADFICYVTPSEHLRLPTVQDVREGVVAARIAAHAGSLARGNAKARARDKAMSEARMALDWEAQIRHSIDPARARKMRQESRPSDEDVCTMCADFCAIKLQREVRGKKGRK